MPTISVIVPVYNVEPYLRQCVDSILGQTFRDFELILVDDGSPDGCPAICDEYAEKDSRVKVIHKENGGLSSARNAGLDVAAGEYIAFVDSDDWIHPEYLERMLAVIKNIHADMAMCGVEKFWEDKPRAEQFPLADECLPHDKAVSLMTTSIWYHMIACNKLYRKSLFDGIRFPEGYLHEDEAIFHRIVERCNQVALVKDVMYHYRQTKSSIMHQVYRIQRSDKLTALADRIVFSYVHHWTEVCSVVSLKYVEMFFDYYFRFPRTEENEKYFRRMEDSLKIALPYILKSKSVSLRHKVYLAAIRVNPQIYAVLKRLLKGGNEEE